MADARGRLTMDDPDKPEHPADLAIRMVRRLNGQDAQMLCYYLGADGAGRTSLTSTAAHFKVPKERARQCIGRARDLVRAAMGAGEIDDATLDKLIMAGYMRESSAAGERARDSSRDPCADVVARVHAERWPQRQDSTLDQLRDLVPVAVALGCYDAADLMRRMTEKEETARDAVLKANEERNR